MSENQADTAAGRLKMLSRSECIEVLNGADDAIGILGEELGWLHQFAIEFAHCNPDAPHAEDFKAAVARARTNVNDARAWFRTSIGFYSRVADHERAQASPRKGGAA